MRGSSAFVNTLETSPLTLGRVINIFKKLHNIIYSIIKK